MTPADAVVAAAQASASWPVFDTAVPDQPSGNRWAVVYPDEGTFAALSLCGSGEQGVVRFQVNSVGPTRQTAAFLAGQIRDGFTGWLAIDGFTDAAVEHELSVQARPDEDVRSVPLVVCTDLFSMTVTKV